MSSFTDKLVISPVNGTGKWTLDAPFRYWITGLHDGGEVITVPIGFVTDFASIPRLFWNILPPWRKYGKAAIVHDYLYSAGTKPKKQCDQIFLDAMEVLGVSWLVRNIMYQAVNWFGFAAWNGHRKNDEEKS